MRHKARPQTSPIFLPRFDQPGRDTLRQGRTAGAKNDGGRPAWLDKDRRDAHLIKFCPDTCARESGGKYATRHAWLVGLASFVAARGAAGAGDNEASSVPVTVPQATPSNRWSIRSSIFESSDASNFLAISASLEARVGKSSVHHIRGKRPPRPLDDQSMQRRSLFTTLFFSGELRIRVWKNISSGTNTCLKKSRNCGLVRI